MPQFRKKLTIYLNVSELEGAKNFMNAVRDGESVLMGVGDENECHLWVMALYRATGQSHKPTPPTTSDTHHKIMGGRVLNALRTAERDETLKKTISCY